MASVSSFGVVVSVISEEPKIRKVRRTAIFTAKTIPSRVSVKGPSVQTGVPGVRKRLNSMVIRRMNITAFIPRTI